MLEPLWKQFSSLVCYNAKHSLTVWSRKYTPDYLQNLLENLHPHTQNLHMNVYNNFIHNHQKTESNLDALQWVNE